VMVIDNEQDFLTIAKINLQELGKYDVLALLSAKDIVSQAHSFKPDIILLDVLMSPVTGIEACEMLKNDPICKNIPVIILSVLDKEVDKLKAYKVGVIDYIVKPVGGEALVARIEKILQSK